MAAQACACAGVGSAKDAENQALVGAEKPSSGCVRTGYLAGMRPSCLLAKTIAPGRPGRMAAV